MSDTQQGLRIVDVSVDFGGVKALKNVSGTARPGTVLGVVGPNGAGKTTLFNVISGVVRSSSGSVHLDSTDLTRLPVHQRTRHGVSRTFQNLALNEDMTVLENVLMGTYRRVPLTAPRLLFEALTGRGVTREQHARRDAFTVIEKLGLSTDIDRRVSELPFGTRRRVDLARALAGRPQVVLLDEPFSGLGDRERPLMTDTIRSIAADSEVCLVLVEHDMTVVTDLCDDLMVLNEGAVIAHGAPSEMLADPVVKQAYLGPELQRRRKAAVT